MGWLSFTNITYVIFAGYLAFTFNSFYEMFYPHECNVNDQNSKYNCIYSIKNWQERYTLAVCIPSKSKTGSNLDCQQLIDFGEFNVKESFSKNVVIQIPAKTRRNGTLSAYVLLGPKFKFQDTKSISLSNNIFYKDLKLTKYKINDTNKYINLLENSKILGENEPKEKEVKKPITHMLTKVNILTLDSEINFDRHQIPQEIFSDLRLTDKNEYLPILHVNRLVVKDDDYTVLNESQIEYNLTFTHSPSSIGKLRFYKQFENSMEAMKQYGFNDAQLKEITSLFTDTNLNLILLTFLVSAFHLLFEFLAFRNDINFWRKRKTTVGLSLKTLAWRAISQIIIFFYLMEEETSVLILVPSGISVFIELWKLTKAFKISIKFTSLIPSIQFGEASKEEKESNDYDSIAMTKLSYLLYPLCIGGAIYSLIYNTHKNWYSWVINSLVNGVYAFGFLFMTPQLFLNYKLKSVAHLPWKAFMYKAFNTFIDDVFAFIIVMPTTHRLACLRDDIVFLVYLYQRWLYPIDRTRVNEFGESFDDSKSKKE